jgi:hypothetical protein
MTSAQATAALLRRTTVKLLEAAEKIDPTLGYILVAFVPTDGDRLAADCAANMGPALSAEALEALLPQMREASSPRLH